MKKLYWFISALILNVGTAFAEPIQYFGTPMFYSKFVPDEFVCNYNPKALFGYCGDRTLPEEAIVGYTLKDDSTQGTGASIRMYNEVVCLLGECKSQYGEPYGQVKELGTSYWYVPTGFYLATGPKGTTAFKHGNGPMADQYPIRNVKVIPELNDPPRGKIKAYKDTLIRYDVYCNPVEECSYMGRVMLATQLVKYIPKVLTTNCSTRFCYNPDLTIAGLNPKT